MVSHWSLSDSKSPQVTRTLLNILADHNNTVFWCVSSRSLISKFYSSRTNLLVTVPSAPIKIGITIIFMFHSFFDSLAMSRYLSLFSLSFSFAPWSAGMAKSTIKQVLFFFLSFLIIIRSGCLAEIRFTHQEFISFPFFFASATSGGLLLESE